MRYNRVALIQNYLSLKSIDTKFKGAVKKRKFFYNSFLGDRKKRCRMDKLSKIKASDLVLLARRRTKVRRVAKFVRSIKHNSFHQF